SRRSESPYEWLRRRGRASRFSFRQLHVNVIALDLDRVDLRRDHGRQACDGARLEVEAGAVLRALDLELEQLAAAEQKVLVRADVVDGVELAVPACARQISVSSAITAFS